MSNENDQNQDEPDHIKDLRQKASDGQAAASENAILKREMEFMRVGIDTSSKAAKAMIASYDGELTKDALLAEAAEWNVAPAAGDKTPPADKSDTTPPPNQSPPGEQKPYGEGSPEHQFQNAQGASGGAPPVGDPPKKGGIDAALERFQANRKEGMGRRDAEAAAFGDVIKAGLEGDKQALFNQREWDEKAARAGHGAEFAR